MRLSWGPGSEGEAPIHVFDPPRRFGWTERHGEDEQGRPVEIMVEFQVESRGETTAVRLVHSGLSTAPEWDDMYDALRDGWSYFLFNLQHYVEHHRGKPRDMVWSRTPTELSRRDVWQRLLEDFISVRGELLPGGRFTVHLEDGHAGRIVSARAGHHFAGRLPDLAESLLFVEVEGSTVGFWLSTYGLDPERVTALQRSLDAVVEDLLR